MQYSLLYCSSVWSTCSYRINEATHSVNYNHAPSQSSDGSCVFRCDNLLKSLSEVLRPFKTFQNLKKNSFKPLKTSILSNAWKVFITFKNHWNLPKTLETFLKTSNTFKTFIKPSRVSWVFQSPSEQFKTSQTNSSHLTKTFPFETKQTKNFDFTHSPQSSLRSFVSTFYVL